MTPATAANGMVRSNSRSSLQSCWGSDELKEQRHAQQIKSDCCHDWHRHRGEFVPVIGFDQRGQLCYGIVVPKVWPGKGGVRRVVAAGARGRGYRRRCMSQFEFGQSVGRPRVCAVSPAAALRVSASDWAVTNRTMLKEKIACRELR
jgi:hypothetical protein